MSTMDTSHSVEERLYCLVKKCLQENKIDCSKLTISKRARDFQDGEFVVPTGCLPCSPTPTILKDLEQTLQQATSKDVLPVGRVDQNMHCSVVLHIQRCAAFRNVVSKVITAGDQYGLCPRPRSSEILLNVPQLRGLVPTDDGSLPLSLSQLRAVILSQHVALLLRAHGLRVRNVESAPLPSVIQALVDGEVGVNQRDFPSSTPEMTGTLFERCRSSPYRERTESTAQLADSGEDRVPACCEVSSERVVLNLRRFMEDSGIAVGKTAYDRNISLVEVEAAEKDGTIVTHMATLESACSHLTPQQGESQTCLHLVPQSQQLLQQQIDLVWSMVSQTGAGVCKCHLVYGPVMGRRNKGNSSGMGAEEFCRLRHDQMRAAAVMKYGEEVDGLDWKPVLLNLTAASIKFDLLTTVCRNTVRVDLSSKDADNRVGAFVLYNCARLAMLQQHFQQAVVQGTYPPLPPLDEVQFHLLTEEEEWTLLFTYIYAFPDVVQHSVESLTPSSSDIHAKIHTHKVPNLLVSMCRCLSTYYSRTHILGEPKPHLLPLMYARLYLMKAAHTVLSCGLRLMGLTPPTQL